MIRTVICTYLLYSLYFVSSAQSLENFIEVSNEVGVSMYYENAMFGQGVSFYDFDNDGWDDLTLCSQNNGNYLFKNSNGTFEPWQNFPVPQAKSCLWGDLDNDGDNEIIFSTLNNGLYLFTAQPNGYFIQVPNAFNWLDQFNEGFNNLWLFGMSLSDYNADGYLDLVVANYNTERSNLAFINQQNLQFTLDLNTAVKYFHKATFQPACVDVNSDLLPEVYFANDYEQGNDFFFNQLDTTGQNIWSIASETTGLNIAINSMCNSWCDYDNDQDLDVYVSNLEPGNKLMQNDGAAQFTDVAESISLAVHDQSWSSLWIDFNNDQWNDLLVTSASADYTYADWSAHFFVSNADGTFADADTLTFPYSAYNSCKGDFNGDGKYDVAMTGANLDVFKLYQNIDSTGNNFIKFTPSGTISNASGVGCHYYLYTPTATQYGYIQSGENYMGQNSQHLILGIGNHPMADSLILLWPSGIIDKYYQVENQTHLLAIEGKSKWYVPEISDGVCHVNDSVLVSLNGPYQFIWDDSTQTSSKILGHGTHHCLVLFENAIIDSLNFEITLWNINHNLTITHAICSMGSTGSIVIQDNSLNSILFPDYPLNLLPIEVYNLTLTDTNGCVWDTIFSINYEHVWSIELEDTLHLCENQNIPWSNFINSNLPIVEVTGWDENATSETESFLLQMTNDHGCSVNDTVFLEWSTIPDLALDSIVQEQETQVQITIDAPATVNFEINQSPLLITDSSGFYNFIIQNNQCYWTDSLWVNVPTVTNVHENQNQNHWFLQNDILFCSNPSPIKSIQVWNILGQQIPTTPAGFNCWQMNTTTPCIFILYDKKITTPKVRI
ncbi:MAG: CRTAC1 family protein [Bacteroidetes bacterium]|nr:CRTAC1 family protein [Bacteroidota bacterium]